MFDGAPADQFRQFIAPRTSLPLHLSFPLNPNTFPSSFDLYSNHHHHHQLPPLQFQPNNLLHPLHHHSLTNKHDDNQEPSTAVPMNFEIVNERERQLPQLNVTDHNSWTNDEVLALFRIRSTVETCFPDLTWDHVSRKLAELGFKRSSDKCKEKFEEESRYFNSSINYTKNNYRFPSELEEFYQGDQNTDQADTEKSTQQMEKPSEGQDKNMGQPNDTSVAGQCEESEKVEKSKERKRKRQGSKFEVFKGFCENIVKKMMAQQEEMHNKLLEDMLRRDEEKFAREEAWKEQEMDRMNKELEMMAQEQAIVGDRQATLIEFLKKFTSSLPPIQTQLGAENGKDNLKVTNTSNPNTPNSSSQLHSKNPSPAPHVSPFASSMVENQPQESSALQITRKEILPAENPNSCLAPTTSEVHSSSASIPAPMNPSSFTSQNSSLETSPISAYKEDIGRRWPRDEVQALINLRCSLNNNSTEEKEGTKAPLWERISQGMLELGYKRSAKRCKEKWENINKYFRKTKDVNKKRSLDSRTCPYFHQLSTLYSQGKLASQSEKPENDHLNSPANHGQVPQETRAAVESSDRVGPSGFTMRNVDGGEKTLMQEPALEFEF